MKKMRILLLATMAVFLLPLSSLASEADLKIPRLDPAQNTLLYFGFVVCFLGILFSLYYLRRIKNLPVHQSMLQVSQTIFETCKTYLIQQGKFLALLFIIIGACIGFYFGYLQAYAFNGLTLILIWTVIGILGSYSVAWFGIRMNTLANSRMAFASLRGRPLRLLNIPLESGMSIGVMLICVELIMMLIILLFVPREFAGASFIGFAIGESLGASALRIAGGIFTKIADIGSDLMKVVFKIKEDDPRNPGVIADCTGDNAGDSVGPTADGFETYGVTGVALISFIVLAVGFIPGMDENTRIICQTTLLTWIFSLRIVMVITSMIAFWLNKKISRSLYGGKSYLDFEKPLSHLVWLTSLLSIGVTFLVSYLQLSFLPNNLWLTLSVIISCGTLGAALIPEFTKIFTSTKSRHVQEVVEASREGGASLTVLSGFVAGNFSAFWQGLVFLALMFVAYFASTFGLSAIMGYPAIFAFGLVAFGFLSMGPVTIAVDSYGPVTDNAQSVYELSGIEELNNGSLETTGQEIEKDFFFEPDFEKAKGYLEANDGAGNTFKATAKPVLIGTAVVGATTMIFSIILLIKQAFAIEPEQILNVLNPYTILGFLAGGAVIYWFTGASTQAVATGAYRAVEYIKKNIRLEENASQKASTEKSKEVVKICTQYAQKGMLNIFVAIFSFALAFAFFAGYRDLDALTPSVTYAATSFFIAYLLSIAFFGLFQAIFMANAGGAWDNAKKFVEVDLKEKNTPLHEATIIGDTVGDPFKDTSSVSLNPIIKFTTLFGLLAMEIAISEKFYAIAPYLGTGFLILALIFVYRSFYKMRIKKSNR
ncbi:MAG: sodium-translocating pyrophosphatase [Patescibacteria group bacterium]